MLLFTNIYMPTLNRKVREELKGPTPLANKWFCKHKWEKSEFQHVLNGQLERQQCSVCGCVEMR